jgi:hypothetical protein
MANTLLTPKVYANTMLALLVNELVMGKLVTTKFKNEFKKVGQTIKVKRPPEFLIRDGAVAQVQGVTEGEIDVTMDKQRGVDIEFTSLEDTLTVNDLLESEIMKSSAATIAQNIDYELMLSTLEFPSWVGTPGEKINSATDFFAMPQRLDELAVPGTSRAGVLSPADNWALAGAFTGLYAQRDIATDALERARIPLIGNVQPYMTQNVVNLVTGTRVAAGTSQVNGANQNVAYTAINTNDYKQTFLIKGLAAGATVKVGEVFSPAGVNWVNPRSKMDTGINAQFVVLEGVDGVGGYSAATKTYTASGGGLITVTIANPMIIDGAYQTVTAAPADSAPITWMGAPSTAYRQNATFHKSSISLVFAKLTDPFTGQASFASDPETGVTIRYWRTSDGTNDTHLHRWDVLFGVDNVDRRLGTRGSGAA